MKKPKIVMPAAPAVQEKQQTVPIPDATGAETQQAKFEALKKIVTRKGQSSTLLSMQSKRLNGQLHGSLSDLPVNARTGTDIYRG